MKNIWCFFLLFGLLIFTSCEEKGPKGEFTVPNRTSDEAFQETMDAIDNDSYVYNGTVELHYYDGSWHSIGMRELYHYPNGNEWLVRFGRNDYMEVDYTDRGGYSHHVKYMGVDYYY